MTQPPDLKFPALLNNSDEQYYSLADSQIFNVGRNLSANIVITDLQCSREQFQIVQKDGVYFLLNLSANTPTFCNGLQVTAELSLNDNLHNNAAEICCGDSSFTFLLQKQNFTKRESSTPTSKQFSIDQPIPLNQELVFGRDATTSQIYLQHNLVSRTHAKIQIENGQKWITDLQSANGTYVNGHQIKEKTQLQQNDRIDIGPYAFFVDNNQLIPRYEQVKAGLICQNITFVVPDRKTGKDKILLNDISLFIKSREFVCLIGPSGSGKSTLLGVLSGRSQPTRGIVKIGGMILHENFTLLKQRIAVVPQRDILYESLSTNDGLIYTAKLRLPPDTSHAEIQEVADKTILQVGLKEHAATPVLNLSGGQRKRACLGNEILSQPDVLFLDEVTSGLDEQSDREIMSLVKQIASTGKTAIMVTHSLVNVEEYCDKIVILAKNGNLAFYGSPQEAKEYFGVEKLGRIYEQLEKQPPESWKQKFSTSEYYQKNIAVLLTTSPKNDKQKTYKENSDKEFVHRFSRQLTILLERRTQIQLFDWRSLVAVVCQCLLVAMLISLLFGCVKDISNLYEVADKSAKVIFLMVISCIWFGCNNTAKEIVKERNIYSRERDVNLSPVAYYFSKLFFFSIIGFLQALMLFSIVMFMTQVEINYFFGLAMVVLLAVIGTAIGLCVSVFSKTEDFALAMVPIIIIPQIILAGFINPVENLLKGLSTLFISAYWGYGGTASLLEETTSKILKMDDWNFVIPIAALILQLLILVIATITKLVKEK
ncbi:MAG: ATP-binding cassette domain-containing protein [Planctomycetaceae bacterium]|jgi:ABC-type multidrug transport system ATPase subunit/pSer/pThr/pTyr-binding forkhead associated (FHA) protein|nr:ATP-binding cassette domain-containing protein [Planctomycetaceae bacterium]